MTHWHRSPGRRAAMTAADVGLGLSLGAGLAGNLLPSAQAEGALRDAAAT